jgi:hypothetical protein
MKKQVYFLIACTLISMQLMSQSTVTKQRNFDKYSNVQPAKSFLYNFSVHSGTYSDLIGSISLNNNMTWDDPDYVVNLPFQFILNGNNSVTSLVFDGLGSDLSGYNMPGSFSDYLLPFSCDLIDRGYESGTSLSPLSYKVEGNTGSRIVKIEWKNVGSYAEGDPYNMFINFQLWLYEGTNVFELHFGQNNITDPNTFYYFETGANIGILSYNEMLDSLFNINLLNGPATSPQLTALLEPINGTPANGTIYRFSPVTLDISAISAVSSSVSLYPNPAGDIVEIFNPGKEITQVYFHDQTGRLVMITSVSPGSQSIDVSGLSGGLYIITFTDDNYKPVKFIKK